MDNTSDANKPVSTAQQLALDGKANSSHTHTKSQITDFPTLGSAAEADTTDFATAAQGSTADTAVQPADLADVATSGDYDDLTGKPTIPAQFNPVAGDGITLDGTYPNITFNASGGGGGSSGDVVGPASSNANELVLFNGTTGKSIEGTGLRIADRSNNVKSLERFFSSGRTGALRFTVEEWLAYRSTVYTSSSTSLVSSSVAHLFDANSASITRTIDNNSLGAGNDQFNDIIGKVFVLSRIDDNAANTVTLNFGTKKAILGITPPLMLAPLESITLMMVKGAFGGTVSYQIISRYTPSQ